MFITAKTAVVLRNLNDSGLLREPRSYQILTTNLAACVCVSVCAKFDQFLPERSHFDAKRPKFFFPHSNIPIRYIWTAFCVPLSFICYEKQ